MGNIRIGCPATSCARDRAHKMFGLLGGPFRPRTSSRIAEFVSISGGPAGVGEGGGQRASLGSSADVLATDQRHCSNCLRAAGRPTGWNGFLASRGRLDPQSRRFPGGPQLSIKCNKTSGKLRNAPRAATWGDFRKPELTFYFMYPRTGLGIRPGPWPRSL